jgi:formylglycine-generating enzyme required for sulfatase activity
MRIGGALVGLAALTAAGSMAPVPATGASWIEPRTGMEFVSIPRGTFLMGSPPTEEHREAQETRHEVTLTRGFELGRYEVPRVSGDG